MTFGRNIQNTPVFSFRADLLSYQLVILSFSAGGRRYKYFNTRRILLKSTVNKILLLLFFGCKRTCCGFVVQHIHNKSKKWNLGFIHLFIRF